MDDLVERLRHQSDIERRNLPSHASTITVAVLVEAAAEITRLRSPGDVAGDVAWKRLSGIFAPITMQDVRLCAGEGKLENRTVLEAVNAILKRRGEMAMLASAPPPPNHPEIPDSSISGEAK